MMKVWVLTLSVTFFIQSRELNPRFFTNSANLWYFHVQPRISVSTFSLGVLNAFDLETHFYIQKLKNKMMQGLRIKKLATLWTKR